MKKKMGYVWTLSGIVLIIAAGLYIYLSFYFLLDLLPGTVSPRKENGSRMISADQPAPPEPKNITSEKRTNVVVKNRKTNPRVEVASSKAVPVEKDLPEKKPEERFATQAMETLSVLDAHVKHPGEVWAKIETPPLGAQDLDEMMEEMAIMYRDTVEHDKPVKIVIWAKGRPLMIKTFFGPPIF